MPDTFKQIEPTSIPDNVFQLIANEWMLITAGNIRSFNTMTASWGAFGELWNKKVCLCFVRPTRHTYGFLEKADTFTLSFFEEEYRDVLRYCGSKSGREVDKIAATGITPVASALGSVYFTEARLVIECRKLYIHDLDPARFLDPSIEKEYPQRDYHRLYLGEVVQVLTRWR